MSPKIAIIITPDGIETVAVLSKKNKDRKSAIDFCSLLDRELRVFEDSIINKSKHLKNNNAIEN